MKMPFFASALALLLAVTPADAALNAYLIMKGSKQGEFKGSVTQKGRENTIMVIAVDHQVRNDRGKVHGVYTITKELDKSSPLLYRALTTGETMASFELQFWTPRVGGAIGGGGTEYQHYTVKLTNARIVDMKFKMLNNKNPELMRYAEFEEVSFTYESISWTWNDGGITTTDTNK
jgi:type VI secretion system secreted protein Hcp